MADRRTTNPPRSGRRLVVAVVLTLWTLLQVATMVKAAVVGGPPSDAFRFWATGLLVLLLAAAGVWAWRWAAEPTGPRPRSGAPDDVPPLPPRAHQGLSGEVEPPTRW